MIPYEQVVVKLNKAVEQSGLSKAEIAKMMGVSEKTLKNYLSGKTKPRVTALVKLCKAINRTPDEIIGLTY